MRKLNAQLVDFLQRWAIWLENPVPGLSYPSSTPESRLRDSPGRSSRIKPAAPVFSQDPAARAVDKAMHRIPETDRAVLTLHYQKRASYAEIALIYGLGTRHAGRYHVEKAHKSIAEALKLPMY